MSRATSSQTPVPIKTLPLMRAIQSDYRVVYQLDSGTHQTYCYEALGRTSPCPLCPLAKVSQGQRAKLTMPGQDGSIYNFLLHPLTSHGTHPVVLETITLHHDNEQDSVEPLYPQLVPLIDLAAQKRQPVQLVVVSFPPNRIALYNRLVLKLSPLLPKGALVGTIPPHHLVAVATDLSPALLASIQERLSKALVLYPHVMVGTLQYLPPETLAHPDLLLHIDSVIRSVTQRLTHHTEDPAGPPPTRLASLAHRMLLHPLVNVQDPTEQLPDLLSALGDHGTLRETVNILQKLVSQGHTAEALIFADLLATLQHLPIDHPLHRGVRIVGHVAQIEALAREAGHWLLEAYQDSHIQGIPYRSIHDYANELGIHPATADALVALATSALHLTTWAPHTGPGRATRVPQPAGLFLLPEERRRGDRRPQTPSRKPSSREQTTSTEHRQRDRRQQRVPPALPHPLYPDITPPPHRRRRG